MPLFTCGLLETFCVLCAVVLALCHTLVHVVGEYLHEDSVPSCTSGKDRPFLTVAILTAPRPNHAVHLVNTLQSLFTQWPSKPENSLYNRLDVVVVNHFGPNHSIVEDARTLFGHAPHTRHYLRVVDKPLVPPAGVNHVFHLQRLHVHSLLEVAAAAGSEYTLLLEDDFPLCPGAWGQLLRLLCDCARDYPDSRGAFAGTGGSGLVLRREHLGPALKALDILPRLQDTKWKTRVDSCIASMNEQIETKESKEKVDEMDPWCEENIKHDIILQSFLLQAPLCVTRSLLFYHIGYASSTFEANGDAQSKPDWQCGWRQPLTERPQAVML